MNNQVSIFDAAILLAVAEPEDLSAGAGCADPTNRSCRCEACGAELEQLAKEGEWISIGDVRRALAAAGIDRDELRRRLGERAKERAAEKGETPDLSRLIEQTAEEDEP